MIENDGLSVGLRSPTRYAGTPDLVPPYNYNVRSTLV